MSKFQELARQLDEERQACADAAQWVWMYRNDNKAQQSAALIDYPAWEVVEWHEGAVKRYDEQRTPFANSARWLWLYQGVAIHELIHCSGPNTSVWCREAVRNYNDAREKVADNAIAHWSRFDKACRNWLEKAEPADIRDTPVPSFSFADGGPLEVQFVPAFIGIGLRGREYVFPTADGYRGPFPTMPERATPANKTTVINIWVRPGDRLDSECADAAEFIWQHGGGSYRANLKYFGHDEIVALAKKEVRRLDAQRVRIADKALTLWDGRWQSEHWLRDQTAGVILASMRAGYGRVARFFDELFQLQVACMLGSLASEHRDSSCADAARWLWATGYVTNSTWLRAEDQETIIKMSRDIIRKLDENRLPSADKARTLAIDYGLGVNSIVYASQQGDI